MKLKNSLIVAFLSALLFLTSCIPEYKVIEKPELQPTNGAFQIKAPVGWIHLTKLETATFITKEGPYVQKIRVSQTPKKNLFRATKVKLKDDVLVTELAEYYIAEYKKTNSRVTVNHIDTLPATIDQKQGFKVVMNFINSKGLVFDVIVYGLYHKDHLYTLYYHAPRLHFFERDLHVFESVVKSFVLL